MRRTFLVTIDLPEEENVESAAEDIRDDLDGYFNVLSVKPWSEHSETSNAPPPIEGELYLGQA